MSSKQRKPIDMAALAAVALPQRDPVAAVVERPRAVPQLRAVKPKAEPKAKEPAATRQPSRAGKVGIQVWTTPEVRKRLRHYATESDRTLDDLIVEAVSDLMRKLEIA